MSFLREVLGRPFATGEIRVVTIPAPEAKPERLLDLDVASPTIFWAPAHGIGVAGVGAAALLRGTGAGRGEAVRAAAAQLWPRLRTVAHPGLVATPPRLFGGLSFLPGPAGGPWQTFGEAAFMLPRLLYAVGGGGARLVVAVGAAEIQEQGPDPICCEVEQALDLLCEDRFAGAASDLFQPRAAPADEAAAGDGHATDWISAVESIQRRIADGRAEKIVAARAREVAFVEPVDAAMVLRRLDLAPAEVRFAFRFDGATFLGATPERLVTRRGLEVLTEALAGSATEGPGRAEALRTNPKDAAEHAFVVRAIADALAPLCTRLEYPEQPRVRRVRHVLHLETPFSGTLRQAIPILDLVARLHPTPAVGGFPTLEAIDWIAREEGVDRGWYAAPVGWFDAAGDGEFVVALRSALVHGDRALLYAGAGIVRASDAEAELAETEMKLRTMLDALGVRP